MEISSLLAFRDYDLVVRCLELVRRHIADFAPECQSWDVRVMALCHHHPDNSYPALAVHDTGCTALEAIEHLGQRADDWARSQPLGWFLEAGTAIEAIKWDALREQGAL